LRDDVDDFGSAAEGGGGDGGDVAGGVVVGGGAVGVGSKPDVPVGGEVVYIAAGGGDSAGCEVTTADGQLLPQVHRDI
jgi:hypothetical protein